MPVAVYLSLLGRCPLASREYAVLRNSVVGAAHREPDYVVETLCEEADAERLLDRAKKFYPAAVPYIEDALKTVRAALTREYRRHPACQTWHFCTNCSQWPGALDYIASAEIPGDSEVCNECIARSNAGDCKQGSG
jgi:hypothetical protein